MNGFFFGLCPCPRYNSASKAFEVVDTKHLSITMDGFTVANSFWTGNKGGGKKQGAPRQ